MTHELTDKQREVIYLAEIFPLYIHRIPPQDNPQSVITGGQPGAGKSGLKEIAKEKDVQGAYDLVLHDYGPDKYIGSVHI